MSIRVATVLSAMSWESELVAMAHATAAVRLVMRSYQPDDIERAAGDIDVVVAGAETAWVGAGRVAGWKRLGLRVVGVYPAHDRPARDLLLAGGADEVVDADTPAAEILATVRLVALTLDRPAPAPIGSLTAVTGPRGAPGRTEVALALAWNWSQHHRTALLDLDVGAPSLAVRLGVAPRPDLTDAADRVRETGELTDDVLHHTGRLHLVVGSHRPDEPPLRLELAEEVLDAALARFERVVVDLGPGLNGTHRVVKRADHAVLVVEAGAAGLVRAARMTAEWSGPPPALVLNRASSRHPADAIEATRQWTGLEPAAVIQEQGRIRAAARAGRTPDRAMLKALAALEAPG